MAAEARVTPWFDSPPAAAGTERFDVMFERQGVVIERITSSGTQPSQRYCEPKDEWVLLLRGTAEMRIGDVTVTLREGDSVRLDALVPHEVLSTSEQALWLAVHVPV